MYFTHAESSQVSAYDILRNQKNYSFAIASHLCLLRSRHSDVARKSIFSCSALFSSSHQIRGAARHSWDSYNLYRPFLIFGDNCCYSERVIAPKLQFTVDNLQLKLFTTIVSRRKRLQSRDNFSLTTPTPT